MKQLLLIKHSGSIQLAHLYEHIFCTQVNKFFYDNHLFLRLDYALSGTSYNSGIICIELELYTKAALALANQVPTFNVTIDTASISIATKQLMAEEERPFDNTGHNTIIQALKELHELPWQDIDKMQQLDAKTIRRTPYPFYVAEGKSLQVSELTANTWLDVRFIQSHRELLPLFHKLAWLLLVNYRHTLADIYGYYSIDDSFVSSQKKVGLSNTFRVIPGRDTRIELSDNLKTVLSVVQDLRQHNGLIRYMAELRETSYYNHSDIAPNVEETYEDTLIFIGAEGWRQLATDENCDLLLRNMSIEIQSGREKVSQLIAD
jgi:hypothetical protein